MTPPARSHNLGQLLFDLATALPIPDSDERRRFLKTMQDHGRPTEAALDAMMACIYDTNGQARAPFERASYANVVAKLPVYEAASTLETPDVVSEAASTFEGLTEFLQFTFGVWPDATLTAAARNIDRFEHTPTPRATKRRNFRIFVTAAVLHLGLVPDINTTTGAVVYDKATMGHLLRHTAVKIQDEKDFLERQERLRLFDELYNEMTEY